MEYRSQWELQHLGQAPRAWVKLARAQCPAIRPLQLRQPRHPCLEEAGLSHQLASLLATLPAASGGPAPTAPEPGLPMTLSQAASSGSSFTGEQVDLNPFSYLLPVQKKFHHITDHIGLAGTG